MDAPVGGRDYPRTLREFNGWFPDGPACLDYLAGLRWGGEFACARCGGQGFWRMSKAWGARTRSSCGEFVFVNQTAE
jgi:Transposase zinc-ribbon domain